MTKYKFSRRSLLQGAASIAGAAAFAGPGGIIPSAFGQTAPKSAVLLVYLRGGYNALFSNADSFAPAATFGVTGTNTRNLGAGLVVDNSSYGTMLPATALAQMASIGVNHGISSHAPAREVQWSNGTRGYALMLANAMGGSSAIKCALVGGSAPDIARPAENGVSMQTITDMSSTINALGGGIADPTIPDRAKAAAALTNARTMSAAQLTTSSDSLASVKNAYDTSIAVLQGGTTVGFDANAVATAYGLAPSTRVVNSFTSQMMAAELMVLAGSNVICAVSNAGWDTHGDRTGTVARNLMNQTILPGLKVFTQRMMAQANLNITIAVFGDFSRSLPGSDHARLIGTTVWGSKVKLGVSGKVGPTVGMPTANPAGEAYSVPGFWSYLAAVSKSAANPFGVNPHAAMVLP